MADDEREDLGLLAKRREFLDTYFRKGAEFTQELLHDNEALRFRVVQLEEELNVARASAPPTATIRELLTRIEQLEREKVSLASRYQQVEDLHRDFESRYQEIERENNDLANLYIASTQLHAAADLGDILATVIEIVLNFIGGKIFALLWRDEDGSFGPLAAEGIDRHRVPRYESGDGIIGEALRTGRLFAESEVHHRAVDLERPAVCVPLRLRHEVMGVLVIWGYLTQKESLVNVDLELFKLLGTQVAPTIKAVRLATSPQDGQLTLRGLRESLGG